MASLTVTPLDRPRVGRVELPGSSLAGSAAMAAAVLADGASTLRHVRIDRTAETIVEILRGLGAVAGLDTDRAQFRTQGWGGHLPEQEGEFDCRGSPLAANLAIGLCALGHGEYRIEAGRPIGSAGADPIDIAPTVDALRDLGARIGDEGQPGRPLVTVRACGLRGGKTTVHRPSAETLATLLVVAPYAASDVFIELDASAMASSAETVCDVIDRFGVAVLERDLARFIVAAPQRYRGGDHAVPPDPVEATMMWMAGAVAGGAITIDVAPDDVPSAMRFALSCLEHLGAAVRRDADGVTVAAPAADPGWRGAQLDLTRYPDLLPSMALLAMFAAGPTRIAGVRHDSQTQALVKEMSKLGATVELTPNTLSVTPPDRIRWVNLDGHDQRVMALSLAVAATAADRPVTVTKAAGAHRDWAGFVSRLTSLK